MNQFKVGDVVKCKPGFSTLENSGGKGYKVDKVFTVGDISYRGYGGGTILWPTTGDSGIYAHACQLLNTPKHNWADSKLIFKFV